MDDINQTASGLVFAFEMKKYYNTRLAYTEIDLRLDAVHSSNHLNFPWEKITLSWLTYTQDHSLFLVHCASIRGIACNLKKQQYIFTIIYNFDRAR